MQVLSYPCRRLQHSRHGFKIPVARMISGYVTVEHLELQSAFHKADSPFVEKIHCADKDMPEVGTVNALVPGQAIASTGIGSIRLVFVEPEAEQRIPALSVP